jgi:hypothetical protein
VRQFPVQMFMFHVLLLVLNLCTICSDLFKLRCQITSASLLVLNLCAIVFLGWSNINFRKGVRASLIFLLHTRTDWNANVLRTIRLSIGLKQQVPTTTALHVRTRQCNCNHARDAFHSACQQSRVIRKEEANTQGQCQISK